MPWEAYKLFRREMACGKKKVFLCRDVFVASDRSRRLDDGNSSNRWCQGLVESVRILSALFLSLEEYRSWRVGRGPPKILSSVRTVHCSLLMSVLVAEPNQTVIDVHRTD